MRNEVLMGVEQEYVSFLVHSQKWAFFLEGSTDKKHREPFRNLKNTQKG
jgi:hypothetical protein